MGLNNQYRNTDNLMKEIRHEKRVFANKEIWNAATLRQEIQTTFLSNIERVKQLTSAIMSINHKHQNVIELKAINLKKL